MQNAPTLRVSAFRICGGWGIRTPEGFHPTRFPSVRHRPLGESSVEHPTGMLDAAPRVAPSRPTPPGRKRSKGNRALAGARGVLFLSGPSRRPGNRDDKRQPGTVAECREGCGLPGSPRPGSAVGPGGYPCSVVTALYRRYRPETFAELIG